MRQFCILGTSGKHLPAIARTLKCSNRSTDLHPACSWVSAWVQICLTVPSEESPEGAVGICHNHSGRAQYRQDQTERSHCRADAETSCQLTSACQGTRDISLVRLLQVPCGNAARAGPAAGEGHCQHCLGHNLLLPTVSLPSTASGTIPTSLAPLAVPVCAHHSCRKCTTLFRGLAV